MKSLEFSYDNAGFSDKEILHAALPLAKEIALLNAIKGYDDPHASIHLPSDKKMLSDVLSLAKRHRGTQCIFVVGIGGSNLGTMAVFEAVKGTYHNQLGRSPAMYFADTVDPDSLYSICAVMESYLTQKKKVLLCFITKSGGTTETVANFEVLYALLRKYQKDDASSSVVAITDQGSALDSLATKLGFAILNLPKLVGGRYSVFSAVGLFPLAVAGVDIKALVNGAAEMKKSCLHTNLLNNPAAISATLLYLHFRKGKNINDNFMFSNDLESVGKWYRQLMGESIGKEYDSGGKKVNVGITPTVSMGSTDLHSMAQLYFGGPYDKFTTFITLQSFNSKLKTPFMKEYDALVPKIQNVPMHKLMDAIIDGVKIACQKNGRPYCQIVLPNKSEHSIGQLLQFKMIEIMMLGKLFNVNPFDQPNVEAYKIETKKILER